MVYLQNAVLFSLKKEGNCIISATGVNMEGVMLSAGSRSWKDKYCMIPSTCSL